MNRTRCPPTEDTTFAANDHRLHRPRSWLINGLQKIRTLDFLTTVANLAAVNFGVDEDPMSYKGTMARVAS
jgi:hypothetical protein